MGLGWSSVVSESVKTFIWILVRPMNSSVLNLGKSGRYFGILTHQADISSESPSIFKSSGDLFVWLWPGKFYQFLLDLWKYLLKLLCSLSHTIQWSFLTSIFNSGICLVYLAVNKSYYMIDIYIHFHWSAPPAVDAVFIFIYSYCNALLG